MKMQSALSAPPLEAVTNDSLMKLKQCSPTNQTKTSSDPKSDENVNCDNNVISRCSSISAVSTSSTPSNSNSNSLSTLSLLSLKTANSSLSSLNINDTQNINISTSTIPLMHDDDNNLRRSSRIKRKRKLGHMTFYTPDSWKKFYSPPTKKRRVTKTKETSKTSTVNKVKPITDASRLLAANKELKKVLHAMKQKKLNWIKYHYDSFEPFLDGKTRRKIKPSLAEKKNLRIESCEKYTEQPSNLCSSYTLRDYQLYSTNWLRDLRVNGAPAILADEMGLGKTIQSISIIASYILDCAATQNETEKHYQSLIVCPLSVSEAWLSEFNKWCPSLRCVLFHGTKLQRENLQRNKLSFGAFDIVITTYEIATSCKSFLSKFYWNYMILDEAHRIKNETTMWHNSLKAIAVKSIYCVLLTGTPIQNNMHELYALLSFLFPSIIVDSTPFDQAYGQAQCVQDKNLLSKTPYLLKPFFLRRLKEEVELTLPPKEEIIIKLNMSVQQKKYYKTYLCAHSSLIDQVSDVLYNGNKSRAKNTVSAWKKLRSLYMELRKIALHPWLLNNLSHKIEWASGDELISHSSKLQLLDKLLAKLINTERHRVLIFSCFTMILDLLEIYCKYRKYKYLRLDGSTSRIRRKIDIMRFNDDPNSPFYIYLISNRAGGLGINLQSADTVIHFDSDWNPQADLQAQARAHRIGQKNIVKIYRIISLNTVEERILFRSQQKLYLDAVVNKGAKLVIDEGKEFDLNNQDLLACIKFGAQKMFEKIGNGHDGNIDDIDLDVLLKRSYKIGGDDENDKNDQSALLKDLSSSNNIRDFNFSMKLVAGNVFEGKTYEKKEFNQDFDVDYSNIKRNGKKTKTAQLIVDGLKFTTRIQSDPMKNFYKLNSENIFETRNTETFRHEMSKCWGCDNDLTADDMDEDDIIKCQQCPKVFHSSSKCWRGEKTRMGTFVCNQHQCYKCLIKTSECGMILRCLGCQISFCYECSPTPHFKSNDGDGLHFVDECEIMEHHKYHLPLTTYMYIFCSNQCKKFYEFDYAKRDLPDLSLKYKDLPKKLRKIIEKNEENESTISRGKKLKNITIDERIASYNMPYKIIDRLKQNIDGKTLLIAEIYNILYQIDVDDKYNEEKEEKDYILPIHCNDKKLKNNNKPFLPQWKQCASCKQWRVFDVQITEISKWLINGNGNDEDWKCSQIQNDFNCDSVQDTPSKYNHDEDDLNMMRLQREVMNIKYKILINRENKVNLDKFQNDLKITKNSMNQIIIKTAQKLERKKDDKFDIADARYRGIGEWNGYDFENKTKDEICKYYQYLIESFRHWTIESLKTICDHFGFLIETKKKKKGGKNDFHIEKISLSYNKDKVIAALALFLMKPKSKFLKLKTSYFRK